jgi:hypothetical protein
VVALMPEKKAPDEKKEYDPEVYKRLELVRKQFQRNAAEQKKQEAAEKKKAFISRITGSKIRIGRLIVYIVLGALVLAVIAVLILAFLAR